MKRLINRKYSKEFLQKICNFVKNKNNFKYKTANLDKDFIKKVEQGIDGLTGYNNYENILSIKEEIANDNPSCIFSGTVYRKLILDDSEIFEYFKKYNSTDGYKYCYKKDLVYEVRECIETGDVQSCSKDLQACMKFNPAFDGIEVIIKFECEDGIDVIEVCNFYSNVCKEEIEKTQDEELIKIKEELDDMIKQYSEESEVLTLIPDDYEIYKIGNIILQEANNYVFIDDIF